MELLHQRYSGTSQSTAGLFFIDGKFSTYLVENPYQEFKVEGDTRIPAGRYKVEFRKVLSNKTKAYRKIYPEFFTWHLMLINVLNYKYVYMHHGNKTKDTDGCLLYNDGINNNSVEDINGNTSRKAFRRIYPIISEALNNDEEVWITIRDEEYILG